MSHPFFIPRWVTAVFVVSTGALSYSAVDMYRTRRAALTFPDTTHVEYSEEYARYPCTVLHGFDVVVRNLYIRPPSYDTKDAGDGLSYRHKGPARSDNASCLWRSTDGTSHRSNISNNNDSSISRINHRTNDRNDTNDDSSNTYAQLYCFNLAHGIVDHVCHCTSWVAHWVRRGRYGDGDVCSEAEIQSSLNARVVVGDGYSATTARQTATPPPQRLTSPSRTHRATTGANASDACAADATIRDDVARHSAERFAGPQRAESEGVAEMSERGNVWPAGLHKYTALILEPSSSSSSSSSSSAGGDSSVDRTRDDSSVSSHHHTLRQLLDTATHQSLVRCDDRATRLSLLTSPKMRSDARSSSNGIASNDTHAVHLNCVSDPTCLSTPYTRVLLTAFLLLPSASFSSMPGLRVGVLGVGGGALPTFLQHFFSRLITRLDLVDVEPSCLYAAVHDMGLRDGLAQRGGCGGAATYLHAMEAETFLRGVCDDAHAQQQQPHATPHDKSIACFTSDACAGHGSADRSTAINSKLAYDNDMYDHDDDYGHRCTDGCGDCMREGSRCVRHDDEAATRLQCEPGAHPHTCRSVAHTVPFPQPRPLFDVLLVDLFVGSELAAQVQTSSFLSRCHTALRWHGVAAFNLPARDLPFVQRCRAVFGANNVCAIPVPRSSNVVVLARRVAYASGAEPPVRSISHRGLYRRAEQLQRLYHLPYDLANHLPWWWRLW